MQIENGNKYVFGISINLCNSILIFYKNTMKRENVNVNVLMFDEMKIILSCIYLGNHFIECKFSAIRQ